ncbi:MAG: ferritin-like protein [Betaproteobacteria bacterium]
MNRKRQVLAGMHHLERVHLLLDDTHRDLEWLEHALQSAVSVEFSTIPPYLCALWSIKDQMHPVAASIRNVVQEEMLHMALACNMLTAIGCVPKINDPMMVPSYPGPIPGAVHPELTVSLSGLSDASLDIFVAIEAPSQEKGPPTTEQGSKGYKTIGAFYDAILEAFRALKPRLATERQVTGPLAYMVMADLAAVEAAIFLIKDQGEGSEATPEVEHTHELAHYYRFLEVRQCRRYSGVDGECRPVFEGDPLPRPAAWPMAFVPKGGYLQADVPPDVWTKINGIDQTFTLLLDRLQVVWELGDQSALVHAIETMFGLTSLAQALMGVEIGEGIGNYGPCFRFLGPGRRQEDSKRARLPRP